MMALPEPDHSKSLAPTHPWDKDYENGELRGVYEPLWHMLTSFLASIPARTVLDFGCGDGSYTSLMGEMGLSVTGIDISEAAIRKAATRECASCEFIRHDSIPRDLPGSSFDAVVMLNSLHCMDRAHRLELYNQVRRVLKPHGYVFASVLALEDESYPRQDWQETSPGTFLDDTGKLFHFFSASELAEELSWLKVRESSMLQNIHPACGRKSALFVVAAEYSRAHGDHCS